MDQTFSTVRHGYSPEEVDSYILELQALIDERNSQLMEYRNREASINRSLLSTQALQQQTLSDASQQAHRILEEATAQASQIRANALSEMTDMGDRIRLMRAELADVANAMDSFMRRYGLEETGPETDLADLTSLYSHRP